MKQLVLFPKGSLISPQDRERMTKNGFIAIEVDDPSKVVLPILTLQISGDDLLISALDAMGVDISQSTLMTKARFVDNFLKNLKNKRIQPTTKHTT